MQALDAALSKAKDKQDFVRETASYEGGKDDREYTLEDYYNFPDDVRAELTDGKLFYMERPSSPYQMALTDMLVQTKNFIDNNHGTCVPLVAPMDVQLDCDDHTMLQPDFVAEVVSPSTSYKDGIPVRMYEEKLKITFSEL